MTKLNPKMDEQIVIPYDVFKHREASPFEYSLDENDVLWYVDPVNYRLLISANGNATLACQWGGEHVYDLLRRGWLDVHAHYVLYKGNWAPSGRSTLLMSACTLCPDNELVALFLMYGAGNVDPEHNYQTLGIRHYKPIEQIQNIMAGRHGKSDYFQYRLALLGAVAVDENILCNGKLLTPLMYAAQQSLPWGTQYLLLLGANPSVRGHDGYTALEQAMQLLAQQTKSNTERSMIMRTQAVVDILTLHTRGLPIS